MSSKPWAKYGRIHVACGWAGRIQGHLSIQVGAVRSMIEKKNIENVSYDRLRDQSMDRLTDGQIRVRICVALD